MRYLPLTDSDRRDMLSAIGATSVDALFKDVPKSVHLSEPVNLPTHQGELEVERALTAMAAENVPAGSVPFFLGAGAYRHHVPASVDHVIQRGEFLTSYTPYQPEISQGTLQYLFEFQTQVALITGMDVANASMYDGATSCAEAALMALRITRRKGVVLSGGLHPHYTETTQTLTKFLDSAIELMPPNIDGDEDITTRITKSTACVIVQYPDMFGRVRDLQPIADACHASGALLVVAMNEVVALGALRAPGQMGADIVAAEGRSLGNQLNFGGPYLGLFATREEFVRQMPGRLSGQTEDVDGRRGWVLTLSTREQHIRREKATSNICTNSGLCALAFTIHLSLLGEAGFRRLASLNHAKTIQLADNLYDAGFTILNDTFFNEFTVRLGTAAAPVVERLAADGVLAGVPVSRLLPNNDAVANLLLVSANEMVTDQHIEQLSAALNRATS
ncbi:aminomethyl-transferring glycine dehydrogenase subunit GcvPA [Alphaproteobacteria bacterium]|nr:aminomethyl-transferring glycine dehydrogenase subunit GcvPA [Alphaproteobacteria bacterium]